MGGLGNQMFQYALGRHLSIKNEVELKLDNSFLLENIPNITKRDYELGIFNIKENFATAEEIKYFKKFGHKAGHINLLFNMGYLPLPYNFFVANWRKYASERHFHFDPEVLKLSSHVYLEGWWNSEKYFKDIRNTILHDFTIMILPSPKNKESAQEIKKVNSVSLHIRRGDYVTNKSTSDYLGALDIDYYRQAIKIIEDRVKNTHFFVFSDDIEWAKENLPLDRNVTFVDWNNGNTAYEDLRLMSLCKHNIIANSSFSWWGAWLNKNKEKIVIAPERWFKNAKESVNTKDLIPSSWIKI